jgi:hypothetical protein
MTLSDDLYYVLRKLVREQHTVFSTFHNHSSTHFPYHDDDDEHHRRQNKFTRMYVCIWTCLRPVPVIFHDLVVSLKKNSTVS